MSFDLPAPPQSNDENSQSEWRRAIRRALLGWRSALDGETHKALSEQICAHFADFLAARSGATVGFYWPIQNEIDVRPVIEKHLKAGGKAALPVVPGKDMPMVFHDWTPETEMVPGFARIPEPKNTKEIPVHVMLAPLVGFDRAGYRLGYGGGFFDRTLGAMTRKPLVVGIGFEATLIDDIKPHQFDVPVDVLITDQGTRMVADGLDPAEHKADQSSPPCHLCS
ncbi:MULTISPECIES: 5-formyltetrahydrofolate cyclo-ligase [Thalassospira]|uniref:5-formyltetrahydrofolate cyclo-ligase n=2 Tax=Thalassospira TaxID=168934 RepID=A0A367W1D1_9PROT|nr:MULTISPECIES: 5-formyltetrahydrofolate cyclo-ligase [Thalassospira]MDG4720267.1 5-formyltetrahydrofolate cyclo-ligase [Thalassospira sp. FZY0004]RCK33115.1 5-formyltetrahydrofolate cyclo-ligase [Thalassospira profundimaris]